MIQFRYSTHPNGNGLRENVTYRARGLATLKRFGTEFWSLTRFWAALMVSVGLQAALVAGYVNVNPFVSRAFSSRIGFDTNNQVIHSRPSLVLASALSLAYLSTVLVVSFPCNLRGTVLVPEQQRLSLLLQTYSFTWALLVFSTVVLRSAEIGSTYFITAWNACALLGCIVGLVEAMTSAPGFEAENGAGPENHTWGGIRYQAISTEEEASGQQSSRIVEDPEPTETTPLVQREHVHSMAPPDERQGAIGWWILQLLLVIPLPVILVFHISVMVLTAMNQTLTDGNNPVLGKSALNVHPRSSRSQPCSIQQCVCHCSPACSAHVAIQHQHPSMVHTPRARHIRTFDCVCMDCIPFLTRSTAQNILCSNREPH